jgi:hypothetical protein
MSLLFINVQYRNAVWSEHFISSKDRKMLPFSYRNWEGHWTKKQVDYILYRPQYAAMSLWLIQIKGLENISIWTWKFEVLSPAFLVQFFFCSFEIEAGLGVREQRLKNTHLAKCYFPALCTFLLWSCSLINNVTHCFLYFKGTVSRNGGWDKTMEW